jgi:hypothetical protein
MVVEVIDEDLKSTFYDQMDARANAKVNIDPS